MVELTRNEELIMLAIWHLHHRAYGVTIRKKFKEMSGKNLNYGSMYNTLYSLVRKGLVAPEKSDPLPERGGRSKNMYYVTLKGKEALGAAFHLHKTAWGNITEATFFEE